MKKILVLFSLFLTVAVMQAHEKISLPSDVPDKVVKSLFTGENTNAAAVYSVDDVSVLNYNLTSADAPGCKNYAYFNSSNYKYEAVSADVLYLKRHKPRPMNIKPNYYSKILHLLNIKKVKKPPLF